jgi:hypothetical protein
MPFVVGRDDEPRRGSVEVCAKAPRRRPPGNASQSLAVGVVRLADLPLPRRVFEPLAEALQLLVAADVEEELDDPGSALRQQRLELGDAREAGAPDLRLDEPAHPHGDDVLVMRAVEDRDLARRRGRPGGSRHRKSCASSIGVGSRNAATRVPCGLRPVKTWRMVPSLPAASSPEARSAGSAAPRRRDDTEGRRGARRRRRSACGRRDGSHGARCAPGRWPPDRASAPGSTR